jgi:hypothetical protein
MSRLKAALTCASLCLLGMDAAPRAAGNDLARSGDVAAQLFAEGEAARADHRFEDALAAYHRIVASHPASAWTMRALVESATCLVALERWSDAMQQLQAVRARSTSDPLAAVAVARNTLLYRLHLRGGQPSHRYAPATGMATTDIDLRRVAGIAVDDQNRVHLGTRKALYIYGENGAITETIPAEDVRGFVVHDGGDVWLDEKSLRSSGRVQRVTSAASGRSRDVDIQAAAAAPDGDILVADRESKSILRIAPDGTYRTGVAPRDVVRLAVSPTGDVAAIERETRAVLLIAQDGTVHSLAPTAQAFTLRAPVDVAFDVFGHLYVLERDAVLVFTPKGEPLAVALPPSAGRGTIGGLKAAAALALDGAGRLYILDEDAERIQIYH